MGQKDSGANASGPSQSIAQNSVQGDSSLVNLFNEIDKTIPAGPLSAAQANQTSAADRGSFAVDESGDGSVTIALPKNLESWKSDYQIVAAVAAIRNIPQQTIVYTTNEWDETNKLSSDQKKSARQYFAGIAAALKHSSVHPTNEYTGSFGQGYYYVIHALADRHNIPKFLMRGTSRTLTQVVTKTVWGGDKLTNELRRLDSLIRRSISHMPIMENLRSFVKTSAQLEKHHIKASLPWGKIGILTSDEVLLMNTLHQELVDDLIDFKKSIDDPNISLNDLITFQSRYKAISDRIKPLDAKTQSVIAQRFAALKHGKTMREQRTEQKLPIEVRVQSLDMVTLMRYFNPAFLAGYRFKVSEEQFTALQEGDQEMATAIRSNFLKFVSGIPDGPIRDSTNVWVSQNNFGNTN